STNFSVAHNVANIGESIAAFQVTSPELQARDSFVIRHSLGVSFALQYAAQHPKTVNKLALLGSGQAAGHTPAARERMCDLATAVKAEGLACAAKVATKSNFYEDKCV
ncbi:hypothetical protein BDU57DRAFT_461636, partial [Ampelomyces quisqualis]